MAPAGRFPPAGPTLAAALLRPLAEQLLEGLALTPHTRVLELSNGAGELAQRVSAAVTVGAPSIPLPWSDAGFDVALSLFAIAADRYLADTLDEVGRVAHTARILLWLDGATHETALDRARAGASPTTRIPAEGGRVLPALPSGWSQRELIDVVRFDGVEQAWRALVTERGVTVAAGAEAATRERLGKHLAAFTAADGTMRIPVRATMLGHGITRRA